jgi:hypothetical protein
MTARMTSLMKAATTSRSSFTPMRSGLLQRKCACGGTPGVDGECDECRRKRLQREAGNSGQGTQNDISVPPIVHKVPRSPGRSPDVRTRAPMEPHRGHNFSTVRVHADSQKPMRVSRTFEEGALDQPSPDGEETWKYSDKGVLMTLAGSGTCVNGGAASACDPDNGAYTIYSNSNTCCTKDCSRLHEQTHVSDITTWGCCKALSVVYNAKGADKGALVQKYNDWLDRARDLTECHAYSNGVACADQLARTEDCAGAGRTTDCCKDVAEYRTKYAAKAKTHCDRAPKEPPPCPAF